MDYSSNTQIMVQNHSAFVKGVKYMIAPKNKTGFNQGVSVSTAIYTDLIAPIVAEKVNNGINQMQKYLKETITAEKLVAICNLTQDEQSVEVRKLLNGLNKIASGEIGNMEKGMVEMVSYFNVLGDD